MPGEGIVLDWNDQSIDAFFDGDADTDGDLRGSPTWMDTPLIVDERIKWRRAIRKRQSLNGLTLEECLDLFESEEELSESNAWYCPRCKKHRRSTKKFEVWKTPDIFIIHLKRFTIRNQYPVKLEPVVTFPIEGLDMSKRVKNHEDGKSLTYDLCAIDNHSGGAGYGHYTAFAKNSISGQWYYCNGMS